MAESCLQRHGQGTEQLGLVSDRSLGRADYPKVALKNKAKKAVTALASVVKGQQWVKMQAAFLAAERDVNAFHKAVNDYYNDFQGGAKSSITILKWTKTAGFISVGVLATTFVGGPLTLAVGLEGDRGAALAAASGAFLKTHVDTVATSDGRELAGEDVDYGKVAWNSLCDSAGNAIIGAIFQGPPAKWFNDKVAKTVVKDFITNKDTLAITSRLGVATTRTLLIKWAQSDGKKQIKAAAPKVAKITQGQRIRTRGVHPRFGHSRQVQGIRGSPQEGRGQTEDVRRPCALPCESGPVPVTALHLRCSDAG